MSQILGGSGKVPSTLGHARMALCFGCEGLSVYSDSRHKLIHQSNPGILLSSFVSTAIVLLSFCCFVLLAPVADAQAVYGSIFGTITDQSGAAVVGARLTVTSVQKGTKFEATSNVAGNYSVTHLIPDQYDLRSEAPGFNAVESTGIPVYADQSARVDVQLQVGANQEKLTVSA